MAYTFVLVHGAWHGAWCWAAVTNQLEKLCDRAFALDLPGHGQNSADRSLVTLNDYVTSVVNFIEGHGLNDVVLVGHSLGGLTIAGVAARIPKRLKRVVFVSAIVPLDGEMLVDLSNPATKATADLINSRPDRSVPIEAMGPNFYEGLMNDVPADVRKWIDSCLCPQPAGPMLAPVAMKAFHESRVPTGYLVCENDKTPVAGAQGWHPHYSSRLRSPALKFVNCGHEIMFTRPAECAQALHEFAEM